MKAAMGTYLQEFHEAVDAVEGLSRCLKHDEPPPSFPQNENPRLNFSTLMNAYERHEFQFSDEDKTTTWEWWGTFGRCMEWRPPDE